ncbi:hypothetical protein CKAH01_04535 [Colletotrichum kahawae]|uniref:Uncharacterized protein n=1 Tax=Colletotrichum kahawae TaxID=34407 RepID=A0AAE0D743_COLKA|nr:hypothetical protein CKAH01_04535 [Colletotrichum kahawae]
MNAEEGYERYGLTITRDDFICPIQYPQTAKWNVALSDKDANKILKGYSPECMEDRWVIRAEGPDPMGNIVCRVYRCHIEWLHLLVVAPRFGSRRNLSTVEGKVERKEENQDARVTEITWETRGPNGSIRVSETDAKTQAFEMCKYLLHCEI